MIVVSAAPNAMLLDVVRREFDSFGPIDLRPTGCERRRDTCATVYRRSLLVLRRGKVRCTQLFNAEITRAERGGRVKKGGREAG